MLHIYIYNYLTTTQINTAKPGFILHFVVPYTAETDDQGSKLHVKLMLHEPILSKNTAGMLRVP